MDPTKAAAMWSNMSNDQKESMQKMFSSMDPSVVANMARSMGGPAMSEDDVRRAQQQMNTDGIPDDISSQASLAQQQQAGRTQYIVSGAEQRKKDANNLFRQGKYDEAVEIYCAILENLGTIPKCDRSNPISKACRLNIAKCKLETHKFPETVEYCDAVLTDYPKDLKALYRRGLAREGLGHYDQSIADFAEAMKYHPGDGDVRRAMDRVLASRDKAVAEGKSTGPKVEEIEEPKAAAAAKPAAKPKAAAAPAVPAMPNVDPAMMNAVLENPDMMKRAQEQMANMDPEVMANMMKAQGMEVDEAQMKAASAMMSSMDTDSMKSMMKMAASVQDDINPAADPKEKMAAMQKKMMEDPEMREQATKMAKDFGNKITNDPAVLNNVKAQASPESVKSMGESMGYNLSDRQAGWLSFIVKCLINIGMAMLYVWKATCAAYAVAFQDSVRGAASVVLLAIFIAWLLGFNV